MTAGVTLIVWSEDQAEETAGHLAHYASTLRPHGVQLLVADRSASESGRQRVGRMSREAGGIFVSNTAIGALLRGVQQALLAATTDYVMLAFPEERPSWETLQGLISAFGTDQNTIVALPVEDMSSVSAPDAMGPVKHAPIIGVFFYLLGTQPGWRGMFKRDEFAGVTGDIAGVASDDSEFTHKAIVVYLLTMGRIAQVRTQGEFDMGDAWRTRSRSGWPAYFGSPAFSQQYRQILALVGKNLPEELFVTPTTPDILASGFAAYFSQRMSWDLMRANVDQIRGVNPSRLEEVAE